MQSAIIISMKLDISTYGGPRYEVLLDPMGVTTIIYLNPPFLPFGNSIPSDPPRIIPINSPSAPITDDPESPWVEKV